MTLDKKDISQKITKHQIHTAIFIVISALTISIIAGCASSSIQHVDTYSDYKKTLTAQSQVKYTENNGAIYQEKATNIFNKGKLGVGDIIKVSVLESTIAKIDNKTNNERTNNINMSLPLIKLPIFNQINTTFNGMGISTKSANKLSGKEETHAVNSLSASMSVGIINEYKISSGSVFEIQGKKQVEMNGILTTFILSGFVHVKDIQTDSQGWGVNSDKINELKVIQSNGEEIHSPLMNKVINKYSPL